MAHTFGHTKSKKKKGGLLSEIRGAGNRFVRGAEDAATGLPSGLKLQVEATGKLLQGDPRPYARLFRDMGKQTYTDVRHPLRNPFSTMLTALGIASLGGGMVARGAAGTSAIARTGKVSQGLKAAANKPVYNRTFTGVSQGGGRAAKQYTVAANPNFLARQIRRATLDAAYNKSRARANQESAKRFSSEVVPARKAVRDAEAALKKLRTQRKAMSEKGTSSLVMKASIDPKISEARKALTKAHADLRKAKTAPVTSKRGRYARYVERKQQDQRSRYGKQARGEDVPGAGKSRVKQDSTSLPEEFWHGPMNAMRMAMYLRPRYYVQNVAGTGALLGIQQGLGAVKSAKQAYKLRKTDRELYEKLRAAMGEGSASSMVMEGTKGKLSGKTQRLATFANTPESHMRVLSLLYEARRAGVKNADDLRRLLESPESNRAFPILQRANEAVVDYSRIGGKSKAGKLEKDFVRSGIPIFYPMTKGFSRWAARYPTQNSIQANYLAQLGMQGREDQIEALGGKIPPPWSPYLTFLGKSKDRILNAQNVLPFSPGVDVLRQITSGAGDPTQSLAQQIGPSAELLYALAGSGVQLGTGFRLPGIDKDSGRLDIISSALRDAAPSLIPGNDVVSMLREAGLEEIPGFGIGVGRPLVGAAYEHPTLLEQLGLWGLGPAATPRRIKKPVLKKQARKRK